MQLLLSQVGAGQTLGLGRPDIPDHAAELVDGHSEIQQELASMKLSMMRR